MKTKVLVLHTSVGYGIKVTALNIHKKLIEDDGFEPRIEDVEKYNEGVLISTSRFVYTLLLTHFSGLWGFLYKSKLVITLTLPLRKLIARFNYKKTLRILREYQPAIVISTEAAPSAVVAYLKSQGLYRGKFVIVFSDYHLHRFWLYKEADLYLCNVPEQVTELIKLKVPAEKIVLTGAVLSGQFLKPIDKQATKTKLGMLTTMPIVLITGGGHMRMAIKQTFLSLLRSPLSFQVVVICGKNEKLRQELFKITAPSHHPIKILGFIDNMDEFMAVSDVLVGKTGGPTVIEAVARKLPMVLTDVRAGHELENLKYLLRHRIVSFGRIPRETVHLVNEVLQGRIKTDFDRAQKLLIQPDSAKSVAQALDLIKPELPKFKISNYQQIKGVR